jgi:hypothetical protein
LLGLASNLHPPELCLLGSWDYRREPPALYYMFPFSLAQLMRTLKERGRLRKSRRAGKKQKSVDSSEDRV